MHPIYKWGQVVNLSANIEELQKLNYQDLKKEMKKSPRFYKTIKSNKAPIILDKSLGLKVDPYKKIGINLLKNYFSEGMMNKDGDEISTIEIKKTLKQIIESEDKTKPLSDIELSVALSNKGYKVARRTVSKYREQLDLPVARLRKEL